MHSKVGEEDTKEEASMEVAPKEEEEEKDEKNDNVS